MSADRQNSSSWFGQNYEKLILIVVLVALLVSALLLVLRIGLGRKSLAEASWDRPGVSPQQVEPVDLTSLEARKTGMDTPFQSSEHPQRLMVSELRVWSVNPEDIRAPIPYDAEVCPFTNFPQPEKPDITTMDSDGDGMPDMYEKEQGLDPFNSDDARGDKDGDLFLNIEEFNSETNPSDPKDFPDPPAKLRLVRSKTIPFILRFQGVNELPDGPRFLLNLRSLERSYFVQIGDEVEGFTATNYQADAPDGPTLTLQSGNKVIPLVKGKRIDRHEKLAGLVFLLDKSTYKVRIGSVIRLKDRDYKIVDIKSNAVSIQDTKTGKTTTVSRLSEAERNELLGVPEEEGFMDVPEDLYRNPRFLPGRAPR